jgi:hypothetical protein
MKSRHGLLPTESIIGVDEARTVIVIVGDLIAAWVLSLTHAVVGSVGKAKGVPDLVTSKSVLRAVTEEA